MLECSHKHLFLLLGFCAASYAVFLVGEGPVKAFGKQSSCFRRARLRFYYHILQIPYILKESLPEKQIPILQRLRLEGGLSLPFLSKNLFFILFGADIV